MAKTLKKRKQLKRFKKPSCPFRGRTELIDYKDVYRLKKFVTTRGRMLPPERTGVSPRCQRKLALEVKKARYMALLPYNELI
ncbi:MAG: 30S ribosomal protein S18 [Candidatus Dojkabacteria bacterium]|uniref:Small ribosomal subunit protein bS18 n=2 Tax=Candidatus Dojkabacteria TaxID=74243 RepID=A0A136KJN2_9BACT|nr:MAG: 30S ribosomal protein S18 [candidate division WS6 bacterium OLB21]MBW7953240.1 30S ribosomal protein S18 [Candidatus Dojkabacteria bacterium]WKZ28385.1 MAG: 30S ribosomal protein S18 [Candidatus Dojkabacteria bacterium]